MKTIKLPTQAQIKELLHYDPETGVLRWKTARSSRVKPFGVAGYKDTNGYIKIQINGVNFRGHRIAWIYMTGEWPQNEVDHKNGVRDDNSWGNLREATRKQNCENLPLATKNKSGFRGVYFDKKRKKWIAQISSNRKVFNLGGYESPQEAYSVCLLKRAEMFSHDTGRDAKQIQEIKK